VDNDTRKYLSLSLAVWEGDSPSDDSAAQRMFEELYDQYVRRVARQENGGSFQPPTERIAAYVAALLERWPNPTREMDDHPVWEDGLVDDGVGPLVHFGVRWDRAEEVRGLAAQVASSMGLVCFDVSRGKLLS
jgi:hypothetical protein